jgi:hypothetical protein
MAITPAMPMLQTKTSKSRRLPQRSKQQPAQPTTTERLTNKQRELKNEIDEIASIMYTDHWRVLEYPADSRTHILKLSRIHLINSIVISQYTLIDDLLASIICNYYFKTPTEQLHYRKLWRTKRFRIFVQDLLDNTYLLNKRQVVNDIKKLPKEINSLIGSISDIRNAIAHSFFPQNRRQFNQYKRVTYKNLDLYTSDGAQRFMGDTHIVIQHLWKIAFPLYYKRNEKSLFHSTVITGSGSP